MAGFDFSLLSPVNEGPVETAVVPGFGHPATHIVRVIEEDGGPERWVDVRHLPDGTRELAGYSGFESSEEAAEWALIEIE